jgi:hypothetical protein
MTQGALSSRIGLTCSGVYLLLALTGCATVQVVTADRLNKQSLIPGGASICSSTFPC